MDHNGDGTNDIIKQTSLSAPTYVGTAFNPTGNPGFFDGTAVHAEARAVTP